MSLDVDIQLEDGGTTIRCCTPKARRFCEDNLIVGAWEGDTFTVNPRVGPILVNFFRDHDLTVKVQHVPET